MLDSSSLLHWAVAAVLVFWAVGAYNRLVRLRGEANAAFGELDAELVKQAKLVRSITEGSDEPASLLGGAESSFWGGLQGAAGQLEAALASARARPLDPERIAALGAAQSVLVMAWERAERDDAHDLAGPRLPESITATRSTMVVQCAGAAKRFCQAVDRYNQAIAQFPAVLLAWLFGFKPGRGLEAMPAPPGRP